MEGHSLWQAGWGYRQWRWLADSAGVAFLERNAEGNQRLVLADVRKKSLAPLTLPTEAVGSFDVRDRQYYVYTVGNPAQWEKSRGQVQASVLGTGRPLPELLFPDDRLYSRPSPQSYLWAVVRGE